LRDNWSNVSRENLFRLIAVLFVSAAIYHAVAFLEPAFSNGEAHWRHATFCGINIFCAWYILRRPLWFVVAFAVLTLQQICSHGAHAWMLWHTQRQLDWLSFTVLVVVPCTLALLIVDGIERRCVDPAAVNGVSRKRRSPHGGTP
jgi:hypothetical protein